MHPFLCSLLLHCGEQHDDFLAGMTAIPLPPLLLDNEQLRLIMREREHWPAGRAAHTPAVIRQLVKQDMLASLGKLQPTPGTSSEDAVWPQQHWPPDLRQLHWELGSSTQLRPVARIMERTALLPDPFVTQGGFWHSSTPLGEPVPCHPTTRLFTALRLDLVLSGVLSLCTPEGQTIELHAGDGWLASFDNPAPGINPGSAATLWTEFYYSPHSCCCKTANNHQPSAT